MAFIGRIMRARALRSAAPPEPAFEPQTSGLTAQQLAAGGKALAMLRMDDRHNQLTQADVLCFLRAAGLVGLTCGLGLACVCRLGAAAHGQASPWQPSGGGAPGPHRTRRLTRWTCGCA